MPFTPQPSGRWLLAAMLLAAVAHPAPAASAGSSGSSVRLPYTVAVDLNSLPRPYRRYYLAAVREAIGSWNRAAPEPVFRWKGRPPADIVIRFVGFLDGACGEIARAEGRSHSRFWVRIALLEMDNAGPHRPENIQYVAAHELGHVLGLGNSTDAAQLMGGDVHWPNGEPALQVPERSFWWPPPEPSIGGQDSREGEFPGYPVWSDGSPTEQALILLWKGDELFLSGEKKDALRYYDRAVSACPGWASGRFRRVKAVHLVHGLDRAASLALRERRVLPHSMPLAVLALDGYLRRKRYQEGVSLAESLLPRFRKQAGFLGIYAALLWSAGRQADGRRLFDQSIRFARSRQARTRLYTRFAGLQGDDPQGLRRALPYLQKAHDERCTAETEFNWGFALWRLRRYREALPHFEHGLRDHSRDAMAGIAAADCCYHLWRLGAAQWYLREYARECHDPAWQKRARRLRADVTFARGAAGSSVAALLVMLGAGSIRLGRRLWARRR